MPISVGNLVTATSYNEIRNLADGLIKTGYGYTSPNLTFSVNTGSVISLADWQNLYLELSRCIIHQTNQSIPGIVEPVSGAILSATFANTLYTSATIAILNSNTVHPNQLDTIISTDTRTLAWNDTIVSRVTYTWPTEEDLNYYLNLGGKVSVDLSYPDLTYTGQNLYWKNLIDATITDLETNGNYFDKSHVPSRLVNQFIDDSGDYIDVSWEKTGATIDATVRLNVAVGGLNLMTITQTTITMNYYSIGDSGPYPYGVPAVLPLVSGLSFDQTALAPAVSRIITASPTSLSFSITALTGSTPQSITLTNIGSLPVTISSITAQSPAAGITGSVSASAFTIAAGAASTVNVTYASTNLTAGVFNTVVLIRSNNQRGTITIPITVTVTAPAFSITLNPSLWTVTASSFNSQAQIFNIIPTVGTTFNNYVASLSQTHNSAFGLNNYGASGPSVYFNPNQVANGTYVSTVTVTAYSSFLPLVSTATATMTITRNIASQNLGVWKSAASTNNSVCGMSYDIVDDIRYLTIGVGAGADGIGEVSAGGDTFVLTNNLGIGSDLNPDKGTALFKAPSNGAYTSFLNQYGAWVRSESNLPHDVEQVRNYTFTVVTAGTYNWTFAADNNGFFAVDSVIVNDRRSVYIEFSTEGNSQSSSGATVAVSDAYSSNTTGSLYLTAGTHTVTIGVTNTEGPGAVALRLQLNVTPFTEVWSTLVPIRATIPYAYWAEVYRIPLTEGAKTYLPSEYVVKNGGYANGDRYGAIMTNGNICTVTDDGYGNLSITFAESFTIANNTSRANTYLPWYYTQLNTVYRIRQLETPPPPGGQANQTRFFLGFNAQGTVITSLVPYPFNTGGGGGGGNDFYIPRIWSGFAVTSVIDFSEFPDDYTGVV